MWRKALARCHPDAGGSHELFLFLQRVRESVCACGAAEAGVRDIRRPPAPAAQQRARVPFDESLGYVDEFVTLTMRALSVGQHAEDPFRCVLALLVDCPAHDHGRAAARQERGATYRQLAAIAHAVRMSGAERCRWYEIARCVPLSEAHASHILSKLKRVAA